jgi:hypothetical protein
VRRDLLPDGLAEAVPQLPAAADLHCVRPGLPNGLAVGPGPCRSAPLDAANVRGQSLPGPHVAGPCAAAVHHGPIVPAELANLGMSSATNVRSCMIARSDGGPCGLAGWGSGDCRRGLGGLGEWVMEWQRSTLRLAHVMWSRRKPSIGYCRAAGNTRGSRSSTGVRGPSCCQRLGATSASAPLAKSLPMAVVAASASVACAWADTFSKGTLAFLGRHSVRHTRTVPSWPPVMTGVLFRGTPMLAGTGGVAFAWG